MYTTGIGNGGAVGICHHPHKKFGAKKNKNKIFFRANIV